MQLLQLSGHLPLAVLHTLAAVGSVVLYSLLGYRRQVVRENLHRAFPQQNAKELTLLEKSVYRNLANVAVEILRARCMPQKALKRRNHTHGSDLLRSASDDFRRPLIVLTLHQGNWEWMLHSIRDFIDMPLVPVYKPLHNAAIDTLMREIRGRFGALPLPIAQVSGNLLQHRREPRCLLMLADQSPIQGEREHWVSFFGRPTAFHLGPARLAHALDAAVIFARCTRTARGRYEVNYQLLAVPQEGLGETEIIERYASASEQAIRAQPETWLWTNRRWKRSP